MFVLVSELCLTLLCFGWSSTPHIAGAVRDEPARKVIFVSCDWGLRASTNTETWVNLHHVGIPPVRVFFRQRRQDPRTCRDRSLAILALPDTSSSHSSSLPHGLQLLRYSKRGKHLCPFNSGRQVTLYRSYIMTGCLCNNAADELRYIRSF